MHTNDPYRLVISKLIELVSNGTLKPNEKVYSENRLANIVGIPRAQVREVYTALRVLGILYGHQGEGTYLRTNELREDTELIYLMMLLEGSNTKDIMNMRLIIETGAAVLAAQNRTQKDIEEMRSHIDIMEQSDSAEIIAEHDALLHYKIAESSGNAIVKCILQVVMGYISRLTKEHWQQILVKKQDAIKNTFFTQHEAIVNAIENKDTVLVREIMTQHLSGIANMFPDENESEAN